jgi:hypothetical protein
MIFHVLHSDVLLMPLIAAIVTPDYLKFGRSRGIRESARDGGPYLRLPLGADVGWLTLVLSFER